MFGSVFGIGLTEMILVGIVILMLFSPRELPGMMKTVAKIYGSVRRSADEFRTQVMEADELREPIEEIRAAYHGTKQELLSAQDLARRELGRARSEAMKAQQKLSQLVREESRRDAPAQNPTPAPAPTSNPVLNPVLKGRVSAMDQLDEDQPAVNTSPAAPASSQPLAAAPESPPALAPTQPVSDRSDAA